MNTIEINISEIMEESEKIFLENNDDIFYCKNIQKNAFNFFKNEYSEEINHFLGEVSKINFQAINNLDVFPSYAFCLFLNENLHKKRSKNFQLNMFNSMINNGVFNSDYFVYDVLSVDVDSLLENNVLDENIDKVLIGKELSKSKTIEMSKKMSEIEDLIHIEISLIIAMFFVSISNVVSEKIPSHMFKLANINIQH